MKVDPNALDAIIGYMAAILVPGLIIWGAAEIGIQQGKRMAYAEFQCPVAGPGQVYQTVDLEKRTVKCFSWRRP